MSQWYYLREGRQAGPVSLAELRRRAAAGQLAPTDRVKHQLPVASAAEPDAVVAPPAPSGAEPVRNALRSATASARQFIRDTVLPRVAAACRHSRDEIFPKVRAAWQSLSRRQKIACLSATAGALALVLVVGVAVVLAARAKPGVGAGPQAGARPANPWPGGGGAVPGQAAVDPGLVGTWVWEKTEVSGGAGGVLAMSQEWTITIGGDGRFVQTKGGSFGSGTGASQSGDTRTGRVERQGASLTFTYDGGGGSTAPFQLSPEGLWLDGKLYQRQ